MKKKAAAKKLVTETGVALVELVIERVKADGFQVLGTCGLPKQAKPKPVAKDVLAGLAFPDGSRLSPSLRRWLAFDGSWVQWFDDLEKPMFKPKKLGRLHHGRVRSRLGLRHARAEARR